MIRKTNTLPKALRAILNTRKRSVIIATQSAGSTYSVQSSAWSEGSRTFTSAYVRPSEYVDGQTIFGEGFTPVTVPSAEAWPSFKPASMEFQPGMVLVESGSFRGKTATPVLVIETELAKAYGFVSVDYNADGSGMHRS